MQAYIYIEALVYDLQGFLLIIEELAGAVNDRNVQPADIRVDNLLPAPYTLCPNSQKCSVPYTLLRIEFSVKRY